MQGFEDEDLQRSSLALRHAHDISSRIQEDRRSSTFALLGEWGSGKTWLLEKIEEQLYKCDSWDKKTREIIHFNPWLYANEDALYAGFAALLLQKTLKKPRVRKKLAKTLQLLGPSVKFGPIDLSGTVNYVGNSLDQKDASSLQNEIAKALASEDKQILIIMDDLDRLTPSELLTLFKLLRLIGDIDGLHYLLAYDEGTLNYLLTQTPIATNSLERAHQYLEKIVEHRWDVPPLTEDQLEKLLFSQLLGPDKRRLDLDLGFKLQSIMRRAFRTPRSVERYLSLVHTIPASVKNELNLDDMYFALFVRLVAPSLWTTMLQEKHTLLGKVLRIGNDDQKQRAERVLERFQSVTEGMALGDDLIELVLERFPELSRALNNHYIGRADAPRIGHPDFFDHYLWLELPPGSISEVAVATALQALPNPDGVSTIEELLRKSPNLLLDSVRRHASNEGVSRAQVIILLSNLYTDHKDSLQQIGESPVTSRRMLSLSREILNEMIREDFDELVSEELSGNVEETLLIELVAYLRRLPNQIINSALADFVSEQRVRYAEKLSSRLLTAPSPSFSETSPRFDLGNLIDLDADTARKLISQQISANNWERIDVLSIYVTLVLSSTGDQWKFRVADMRNDLGDSLYSEFLANSAPLSQAKQEATLQLAGSARQPDQFSQEDGRLLTSILINDPETHIE